MPLLAMSPALRGDFINLDDSVYVTENSAVRAGLTWGGFAWAWSSADAANWHPLTWLSLMLDTQVFGSQPWGYHLVNLLLHLANTIVLFALLRRMTGAVGSSGLVAALFAVHPLHVESVAWISERKDVLSTLFGLLATAAYARYAQAPSLGRYLPVMGCLALSLLAKPMFVTLPFVFLLLDYWPLRRWPAGDTRAASDKSLSLDGEPGASAPGFLSQRIRELTLPARHKVSASRAHLPEPASLRWLVLEKVPLLPLVVLSCLSTLWAQHQGEAVNSLKLTPLSERLANCSLSYIQYLGQTIVPTGLAAFYPHPHGRRDTGLSIVAALLLLAITVLAWRWRRQRPYVLVGWLWYLGTLVPVIGLIQVGGQARADRYTYLPLVGIFLLAAWGLTDWRRRWEKDWLAVGLAAGVLIGLMGATWLQASVWRDSVTLWQHAIEVTENNWMAYKLLNSAWGAQGRLDNAERFFGAILRDRPEDAGAHNALGEVLMDRGKVEEAYRHFQEALRLEPDHPLAHYNLGQILLQQRPAEAARHFRIFLGDNPKSAQGHNLLGLALLEMGQHEEAIVHFEKALQVAPEAARLSVHVPDAAPILFNLGSAWQARRQWSRAAGCFAQSVALKPLNSKYHRALAFAWDQEGRHKEAQGEYRESVRLHPTWPAVSARRAWFLATHPVPQQRNGSLALEYAQQAQQATGDSEPRVADALAAAYAEVGHFEEAVRTAVQAAEQAEKVGQRQLAGQIRERVLLYSRRECYRASP
jgi:tetratricopeptide (TPR) repeat protein